MIFFSWQFLDNRNVPQDSSSSVAATSYRMNDFKNVFNNAEIQNECRAVEPVYNVVVKPLLLTSDDILYCNSLGSESVPQFHEDDLRQNVIHRENFSVIILTDTATSGVPQVDPLYTCKSKKLFEVPLINLSASHTDERHRSTSSGSSATKPSDEQLDRIYNNLCERVSSINIFKVIIATNNGF